VGAHRIYTPSVISPPNPRVHLQEASLALLPIRPVLLHEHHQLLVPLGLPLERAFMGGVLLSVPRFPGQRRHYLEKQSCVPRFGQGHVIVHPSLSSVHFYCHTVRLRAGAKL